ncbi:MAG TPA: alpha/beta hydrolase [Xanthobacteraceae bacterium]|jgi:haloacetate dehalogenase
MTREYIASPIAGQDGTSGVTNYSRRRFLLTGAAAGLSLPLATGESQTADAAATSAREETTTNLFPGFAAETVNTSGTTIYVLRKGTGRPLLLLHGYPETHLTWHKIAPRLAEQFSVVVPDLRGFGHSGRPPDGERHENYSFRAMAQDQVDVMRHYGHERFLVAAHDRGARATHPLCVDHPENVEKAVLMDIAPTLTMYQGTNQEFATKYMWWFFLIQPSPLPEHMIGLDPKFYLQGIFDDLNKTPGAIAPEVMNEYVRAFSNPSTIHTTTENFRAAAGVDLDMDKADDKAGKKIQCPIHALWAAKGTVGALWDVLAAWRAKCAAPVTGRAVDCGHFLQEEAPQDVLAELQQFFSA